MHTKHLQNTTALEIIFTQTQLKLLEPSAWTKRKAKQASPMDSLRVLTFDAIAFCLQKTENYCPLIIWARLERPEAGWWGNEAAMTFFSLRPSDWLFPSISDPVLFLLSPSTTCGQLLHLFEENIPIPRPPFFNLTTHANRKRFLEGHTQKIQDIHKPFRTPSSSASAWKWSDCCLIVFDKTAAVLSCDNGRKSTNCQDAKSSGHYGYSWLVAVTINPLCEYQMWPTCLTSDPAVKPLNWRDSGLYPLSTGSECQLIGLACFQLRD